MTRRSENRRCPVPSELSKRWTSGDDSLEMTAARGSERYLGKESSAEPRVAELQRPVQ